LTSRKELCDWIRNNWRSTRTIHHAPKERKKSKLDVVWRDRQIEVLEEIEKIHIERGTEGEADRFGLRNTAASQVYARLSDDGKAEIERKINSEEQAANPPEIQRKYAFCSCCTNQLILTADGMADERPDMEVKRSANGP
jgi:hypothetical protein